MDQIWLVSEGNLAVVEYMDPSDARYWLATAFVNGDGSLTWTGYRFQYDSTYAGYLDVLIDLEIYPVYVTAVPAELWKELE